MYLLGPFRSRPAGPGHVPAGTGRTTSANREAVASELFRRDCTRPGGLRHKTDPASKMCTEAHPKGHPSTGVVRPSGRDAVRPGLSSNPDEPDTRRPAPGRGVGHPPVYS